MIGRAPRSVQPQVTCRVPQLNIPYLGPRDGRLGSNCAVAPREANDRIISASGHRRSAASCNQPNPVSGGDHVVTKADRAEARFKRAELVAAGLTVLKGFVAGGRPAKLTPFGSFDDYAVIRGALVWLGRADPVATRDRLAVDDPKRGETAESRLIRRLPLWRSTSSKARSCSTKNCLSGLSLPSGAACAFAKPRSGQLGSFRRHAAQNAP